MNPTDESEPFKPLPEASAVPRMLTEDPFAQFRRKFTPAEIAEDDARIAAIKAGRERDARALGLAEWNAAVPEFLRDTNWLDPRLVPYSAQITRVLTWQRSPQGVYAVGRSGRGKSRSIYALARRLAVDELVAVRYLLQTQITRDVNRDGLNQFLEKMDAIRRAPVIVWDDFGKFAAIGSRQDVLLSEIEALCDFRHSHQLPFLISSNATNDDLFEIFGEMRGNPIVRRLSECCQVVNFGWE